MKGRKWSKEEEEFLKENYTVISDKKIARRLGRTLSSIRGKVNFEKGKKSKQSRLINKNNYLTEEQRKKKIKSIIFMATGIYLNDKV